MKFDLTEEQRLLADSVRRFVATDYSFEARKRIVVSASGMSAASWKQLAELGLLALALPAEHEGYGGGAVDLAPVMEAFGDALVLEPYLATVMCARIVVRAGDAAQKAGLLPAVASGATRLALAHLEEGARYDLAHVGLHAVREGDGYVLDGVKRVVLHAPQSDRMVVSARTSGRVGEPAGISLFLVDTGARGVRLQPYRTLDELVAADVVLEGLRVPANARLGDEGGAFGALEEAVDFATALLCAEAVGAIRSANDATLEYLKARKQFGVPIGAFQALQHRMVDMVVHLEQARSMASLACDAMDRGVPANERRRLVSAAKLRVAEACRHVSQEAVQLHGGMGMTEELKVSHTFRRLTMIAQQFGDADFHLGRFASE